MRPLTRRRGFLLTVEIVVPALVIAAWFLFSAESSNPFFPPLTEILVRFRELWLFDYFASDIVPSLAEIFFGFTIGALLGILLGIVLAMFQTIGDALAPIVHFYRAIPPVAVIPIFVALLGFGDDVRVLIIVLACGFTIMVSTVDGIRSVEPVVLDVAKSFRLTSPDRLRFVLLPAAGPHIFSGLQVGLQDAFIVMVAAEMLGASRGVGAMTLLAQQTFRITDMWAGIILLGVIGFGLNLILVAVRGRVLRWHDALAQK